LARFTPLSGEKTGFCLIDESEFGLVLGPNGQKIMLPPEEARAIHESRVKSPRPPRIQQDLLDARQLKERLKKTPGLTKTALARELCISRFELIRRLNLLRLAPEIQEQILAMPPSLSCHCSISKRTLRNIAIIADPEYQKRKFEGLMNGAI